MEVIRRITRYERMSGEIMPPWYYGIAYRDYVRDLDVYAIIPLNIFMKFLRWANIVWYFIRSREDWLDKTIKRDGRAKLLSGREKGSENGGNFGSGF